MTTVSYDSTGSTQTFVVPTGVTVISIELAGGNGGPLWAVPGTGSAPSAGRGALLTADIPVTPGETLTLQIGEAGRYGAITGLNGDRYGGTAGGTLITGLGGYPDGGSGGRTGTTGSFYAGGGGGSSRLWRGGVGGTLLACAAGGGGLGFPDGFTDTATGLTSTGDGGQPSPGENGRNKDHFNVTLLNPGIGATSSAGGAAGTGGTAGGSFSGGNGADYTASPLTRSGGGGGGGRYGGGGGGREDFTVRASGSQGGGGSSYVDGSATGVTWSSNARSTTGGTAEAFHTVQAGGYINITYTVNATPVGWSLGLVKMLG